MTLVFLGPELRGGPGKSDRLLKGYSTESGRAEHQDMLNRILAA